MPFPVHSSRADASTVHRRRFFDRVGDGVGGAALAWLLRLCLYILSIVKHLLTHEAEIKIGDREITFDQKT